MPLSSASSPALISQIRIVPQTGVSVSPGWGLFIQDMLFWGRKRPKPPLHPVSAGTNPSHLDSWPSEASLSGTTCGRTRLLSVFPPVVSVATLHETETTLKLRREAPDRGRPEARILAARIWPSGPRQRTNATRHIFSWVKK